MFRMYKIEFPLALLGPTKIIFPQIIFEEPSVEENILLFRNM